MTREEARKTLARAVVALGRAGDPQAVFDALEPDLSRAAKILGRGPDLRRFLGQCDTVAGPTTTIGPASSSLPPSAMTALEQAMNEATPPVIVAVNGSNEEGYSVELEGDRAAFVLPFAGRWVLAPGPVGREDLVRAREIFDHYFRAEVAPDLRRRGLTPEQCVRVLREATPSRVLWPDETDPLGLCETYPMVVALEAHPAAEQRYFCGLDPISGEGQAGYAAA